MRPGTFITEREGMQRGFTFYPYISGCRLKISGPIPADEDFILKIYSLDRETMFERELTHSAS